MPPKQYTIGEVGFAEWQDERSWLKRIPYLGDARKALLQTVLDREPLPDGLVLVGFSGVGACTVITWDDIRWDTSGLTPKVKHNG